MMNPDYLKKLLCPVSKKPLRYNADTQELISDEAQLAYPIHDGIPILLKTQARSLTSENSPSDQAEENKLL